MIPSKTPKIPKSVFFFTLMLMLKLMLLIPHDFQLNMFAKPENIYETFFSWVLLDDVQVLLSETV